MDIDWLETFVAAAEEENFRRTAERLHLAQPTVTMHVQKLEQTWGIKLFERVGRNVTLSRAGRQFLAHARGMLSAYQNSREDMARLQQGYEETIKIAVSPLIATTYLSQWMRGFSKTHQNVEFSIRVSESTDILEQVLSRQCDIGLSRQETVHPAVNAVRLYSDPVVFVTPTDEYDMEGPVPTVSELLSQYTVFTHNHPEYWDSFLVALRREHPSIRTMQVSQVHVTIHLIAEKMGVSFLPKSTVTRELLRGTVTETPFAFKMPVASTYLITHQSETSPAIRDFAGFITEYMRQRTV